MQTGQKVFVPPGHVSMAFGQPVWLRYERKARDRIFKRNLLIQQDNLFQLKSGNLLAFVVDGLLFQKAKPNLSIKRNLACFLAATVRVKHALCEPRNTGRHFRWSAYASNLIWHTLQSRRQFDQFLSEWWSTIAFHHEHRFKLQMQLNNPPGGPQMQQTKRRNFTRNFYINDTAYSTAGARPFVTFNATFDTYSCSKSVF